MGRGGDIMDYMDRIMTMPFLITIIIQLSRMRTTNISKKGMLINKNMRPLGGHSCAGEDECKTWMDEMRFTGLIKEKNGILTRRCGWQLKEQQQQ